LSFPPETAQAISPQNAYLMQTLLKAVVTEGTGTRARVLGRPVGGKTGTTNEEQDAWFVGFTPYLVVGSYVGFDQLAPMGRGETGARVALPAFIRYMEQVQDRYPSNDFAMPEGVNMQQVYDGSQTVSVPFMAGTGPNTGRGAMSSGDVMDSMAVDPVAPPLVSDDLLKELF
jgi:penicillin-binding protein 1A